MLSSSAVSIVVRVPKPMPTFARPSARVLIGAEREIESGIGLEEETYVDLNVKYAK